MYDTTCNSKYNFNTPYFINVFLKSQSILSEWIDTVATIVPYSFEILSVAIWPMEFEIRHQNIDVAIVMLYVLFSCCFISL